MEWLTDPELSLMHNLLSDEIDKHIHYPNDFTDREKEIASDLLSKTFAECRARRFWWAR